ncbi:MAG: hypothetical protein II670_14555, partial [Alphaproteobacteria bacterium]|nr:hypothetical protein [Alphaproteobacteria bacterium]
MTNVDGVISSFAKNLTPQKTKQANTLTLFEEIRYVYQAILAKLSILEKMGMSGITQTNIDVAEGEFIAIHKSVNLKEKFIISADFFRKLAEILYYKNSLTILSQNQDSLYASVYYGDYDLLAYLDDYCMYGAPAGSNALEIKRHVKFFFNWMNSESASQSDNSHPYFSYKEFRDNDEDNTGHAKSLAKLFETLRDTYVVNLDWLKNHNSPLLPLPQGDNHNRDNKIEKIKKDVTGFLDYNIKKVSTNESEFFFFGSLDYCDFHRHMMRNDNLRPACYACKYYTRSLRILANNMFDKKDVLQNAHTKSLGILHLSFKNKLLYTNSNSIKTLAQTLEGFGNVMFACASGNNYENDDYKPDHGIEPNIIVALTKLLDNITPPNQVIDNLEKALNNDERGKIKLSRLDKSILYYLDAYRFYLINANYNEAVGCLKKMITIITYYVEVLSYQPSKTPLWGNNESDTIKYLIHGEESDGAKPLIEVLFKQVVRYTGYKYDHINIS